MLAKLKRCPARLAKHIAKCMAAVAFLEMGAKAGSSKLKALQQLAGCGSITDDVRSFAVARAFALATEHLTCLAVSDAVEADSKGQAGAAAGSTPGGKSSVPQHKATLLPEVRVAAAHVHAA